jgi:D-tyrosyl-tRNA(Tyr) deacylase
VSIILVFAILNLIFKMITVLQRTSKASVEIEGEIVGQISQGFVVLLGIAAEDTAEDIDWLATKIINLRVFGDAEGKMNLSLLDIAGNILLISQFTLYANCKKGNRPSFTDAAKPAIAIPLYEKFIEILQQKLGKTIATGKFGADMQVSLINDGPVTIILDSKNRK